MNLRSLNRNEYEFIAESIYKKIIIDTLPFNMVENKGFHTSISSIELYYTIPLLHVLKKCT